MSDTQTPQNPQADDAGAEQAQAGQKPIPWTDVDKAIVLNNILNQYSAAGGKPIDWKVVSEALPGRSISSLRSVWDRYKHDVKVAAAGEGEVVAVPGKKKATPRKKAAPKSTATIPGDTTEVEDNAETPTKKRGGGRKRAAETEGEDGSAKKKRTPKKTAPKKAAPKAIEAAPKAIEAPTANTGTEAEHANEALATVAEEAAVTKDAVPAPSTEAGVDVDAGVEGTKE
ncbi:hypothetical protein ACHAQA_005600 [Verticillium albo-atrum]